MVSVRFEGEPGMLRDVRGWKSGVPGKRNRGAFFKRGRNQQTAAQTKVDCHDIARKPTDSQAADASQIGGSFCGIVTAAIILGSNIKAIRDKPYNMRPK